MEVAGSVGTDLAYIKRCLSEVPGPCRKGDNVTIDTLCKGEF